MKKLIAAAAVLALANVSLAAFTLNLVSVDNSAGTTDGVDPIIAATDYTYDLVFDSTDEVWSATNLQASVTGGTFFQHAINSNVLNPNAAFPATEFDTGAIAPYGAYLEAPGFSATPTSIAHAFGDTNANLQDPSVNPVGIYRFTVRLDNADVPGTLTVGGQLSTLQGVSQSIDPITITVPEPASLSLIGLAFAGLIRRR